MKSPITLLMLCLSINVAASDSALICQGKYQTSGIRRPTGMDLGEINETVDQQYILAPKSLTIVGSGTVKNDTLPLCETSTSHYTFAWDCKVTDLSTFVKDWLSTPADDREYKSFRDKWLTEPSSYYGARVVRVNRFSLEVDDAEVGLRWTTVLPKPGSKEIRSHYWIERTQMNLSCKQSKAKI